MLPALSSLATEKQAADFLCGNAACFVVLWNAPALRIISGFGKQRIVGCEEADGI